MSISGDLQDVSVAEVMQFVHLGRRTGTLKIRRGRAEASIGFHRGRIISAWTPQSQRLGELLLEKELIVQRDLEAALAEQESQRPRPSLGKVLLERGLINEDRLRDLIGHQIEETIYRLVTWKEGTFDFALDELRPIDDVGVYPGDILPDINLDTQMVVLDGLRIFDERNRKTLAAEEEAVEDDSEAESAAGDRQPETGDLAEEPAPAALRDEQSAGAMAEKAPATAAAKPASDSLADLFDDDDEDEEGEDVDTQEAPAALRFQVVSDDPTLVSQLRKVVPQQLALVTENRLFEAGLTLPGEAPPVVLVDLRESEDMTELATLSRSRPRASILTVVDPWVAPVGCYEAGALAALPPDPEAISACLRSLVRSWTAVADGAGEPETAAGFARLRRVVADLRSGLLSATVALNLMQVISESVERAIMFLVRGDNLVALGAFGSHPEGTPLATSTSGLTIHFDAAGALGAAVDQGRTRSILFDDADLPGHFVTTVGRPRTGQAVIFPVMGTERVISVVYADNGQLSREIEEIEILELAAAQVGVAFENEMLRRKLERGK